MVKSLDLKIDPKHQNKMEEFQQYIFDLSAEFIALPATKVAEEIDRRLREIGEFWDFGQIFLSRLSDNGHILETIHAYSAPGVRPSPVSA